MTSSRQPEKTDNMNAISNPQEFPVWQGGELRCIARSEETHDTASFVLAAESPARFQFLPGQFVTIGVNIDDSVHYRAYSISSTPDRTDRLTLTIRRLPGGRVSNYLLDHLKAGAKVEATTPAGEFFLDEGAADEKLLMLSAGSGVTPVMSMVRWLLARRPDADIHFIYSARSEQDIIFREELISMAHRHPNFRLDLFLDNTSGGRDRHDGFLTPERLDALVKDAAERRIYLCGNQPYMDMVEDWHQSRGLAAGRLHKESFKPDAPEADAGSGSEYQFTAPQFGKTSKIRDGQTLLEIMEPNAIPIIAACRSGVCGSCKCKVVEGEVERVSTATLTAEELAEGFVLACSTRAKSDLVVELVF